jgi:hypothetical protein
MTQVLDQLTNTAHQLGFASRDPGDLDLIHQLGQASQFVDETQRPGHGVDDR